MVFDEKVLTALEVLTDAAENDFELYRICTLIRDLVAPPVVEQVDETHQRFNGVTYFEEKRGHYVSHNGVHRAVWQYYNGEAPTGYDIHHIDRDKENNSIDNLLLLSTSEHMRMHFQLDGKRLFVCKNCGKEYYAYRSKINKYCPYCAKLSVTRNKPHTKKCPICGEPFQTNLQNQKYCSRKCACQARTQAALVTKICPVCGKEFTQRRCDERKTCSPKCSISLSIKNRIKNKRPRPLKPTTSTCLNCGKTFARGNHLGPTRKFCSKCCRRAYYRKTVTVKKLCPVCGKEFDSPADQPRKCCSIACANKLKGNLRKQQQITT